MSKKTVLILGGAGFIGSNIAEVFADAGDDIVVVDGLLPQTGGKKENLESCKNKIRLILKRVEEVKNLAGIVKKSDVIIDCMGFTSHKIGMENPAYDIELNLLSHLSLIKALKGFKDKKVIYIGSRVQYGADTEPVIREKTPMIPEDAQGINKLSAEHYFRIYSKLYNLDAVSLRLSNCFGKNQKTESDDIGLVGSIIKDILNGRKAKIIGPERTRYLIYAPDLANVIFEISGKFPKGFNAFNLGGKRVSLKNLSSKIVKSAGRGSCEFLSMKEKDMGGARMDQSKLQKLLGKKIQFTPLEKALKETISYFKSKL